MENNYCVYIHTNKINNKKYVGITKQNPLARWGINGNGYKKQAFYNAILKYGWENFDHEIVLDNLTMEQACNKERELIALYKSNNNKYGYNATPGGENGHNELWNDEEYCLKMSQKRKELWKNEEFREKHKKSMQIAIQSPEYKEKIRKNTSKNWEEGLYDEQCIQVMHLETGIIYKSITNASKKTGHKRGNINKCCNGTFFGMDGFHWIFYKGVNYTEEERVKMIQELEIKKHPYVIRCIETQKNYLTASDIKRLLGFDNSAILKSIKKGSTSYGYHWEKVKNEIGLIIEE